MNGVVVSLWVGFGVMLGAGCAAEASPEQLQQEYAAKQEKLAARLTTRTPSAVALAAKYQIGGLCPNNSGTGYVGQNASQELIDCCRDSGCSVVQERGDNGCFYESCDCGLGTPGDLTDFLSGALNDDYAFLDCATD